MHLSNNKSDHIHKKSTDNHNGNNIFSANSNQSDDCDNFHSISQQSLIEEKNALTNYRSIEEVLKALTAHSIPQSAATSWSGTKSNDSNNSDSPTNHLSCLFNTHNIAEIGKNKNVIKQFIDYRGVFLINKYQGLIVDKEIGMIIVRCSLPTCDLKMPLIEARNIFKSCHHCFTYYCSAQCRQKDWIEHKMRNCPIGRTESVLKSVIRKILSDETTHNVFSNLGRGGFLRMGRGCIVIWFPSCSEAERFAESGSSQMDNNYPVFVCIKNINVLISKFVPNSLTAIHEACKTYDPDRSIVINISIAIDENLLKICPAKMRHSTVHAVKKCVTISLSNVFMNSIANKHIYDEFRPTSLLLTMLPSQQNSDNLSYNDRQIIFVNILRQLESRGVNLKGQYPFLYRNLMNFVEKNSVFSPTTIYPIDSTTGRAFVCMIAPQTESVTSISRYDNVQSNRSSVGSFMAELDAMTSGWEKYEITDL